jgi:ankyrin repeat protein
MMFERSQQLEEFLDTLRDSNGFGSFDEISERSFSEDTVLHVAVRFFENDVVPELLALGVDINAIGDMKQTPLHVAVSVNNLAMAEYLIDRGASLVVCDELHGQPPFFGAMLKENDEMVYLLFRKIFGEYNAGWKKKIVDSWAQFHLRQKERLHAIDKMAHEDRDTT